MAVGGVLRVPQLQLRHGDLPLQQRPGLGGLRGGRLPRPPPALPLPPPPRAPARRAAAGTAAPQGGRLGALHLAHSHVLLQGRRHHAMVVRRGCLGHGCRYSHRWIRRFLRAPGGRLKRGVYGLSSGEEEMCYILHVSSRRKLGESAMVR